jgi:hypothetical protein
MDDADYEDLEALWRDLEPSLAGLSSLEDVAHLFTGARCGRSVERPAPLARSSPHPAALGAIHRGDSDDLAPAA